VPLLVRRGRAKVILAARVAGRWSITVNGNWRLTFIFEGTDVVLLDYEDYH
jgi:proteic killer suppression protein